MHSLQRPEEGTRSPELDSSSPELLSMGWGWGGVVVVVVVMLGTKSMTSERAIAFYLLSHPSSPLDFGTRESHASRQVAGCGPEISGLCFICFAK